MAIDVVDAPFFHINSNANGSAHDLMRRGDIIEVGGHISPFFRFYESYARMYPVRQQDGSVLNVPAIAFLNGVKDGSITSDNLPVTAWEISRHFMMLARELIWENIRLLEFQCEPSRQRCIWLLENEEQVRQWLRTLGFQPMTHWVVKVRATGRALKVDSRILAGDSEPLPVWYDRARRYWRGEMTADPHAEVLFAGTLHVEEIIDPASFGPASNPT